MTIVYRADQVPAGSRVDYWEQVLADELLPLRGTHAGDFTGHLLIGQIGAVRVTEATTPAGECARTPELVRRSSRDLYQIDVMARGRAIVDQGGRTARLRPGDIAFIDPSHPVRYRSSASTHISVLFPREMLPLRPDDVARLTGERVPGDRGAGALVSSLARQLPRHLDEYHATEAARLGTALVDLLRVALAARLDARAPATPGAQDLLARVYAFVDAHLGDPELSAAAITQRDRTVSAIAKRWGLPNAAHFSRAFKAA